MPEAVGTSEERLRVITRPAFGNRLNPYNARIYGRLSAHGVEVVEYRVPHVWLERADVVHVHWPESTFNHGLVQAQVTTGFLLRALRRLKRRGAKCLWTIHNLRAHERRFPREEERFWERYLELLDGVVALSEAGLAVAQKERPVLERLPAFVIPHPHYRGEYPDTLDRRAARDLLRLPHAARVLLFFGQVKEYKNVPALIRCARKLPDDVRLIVAGKPRDAVLSREVEDAAEGDPRVVLRLEFVPMVEAERYFRAADLIVLPYREILNSGSALLGLSFDRPVHLPPGDTTEELRRTVGGDWVHAGSLEPENLLAALETTQALPERTRGEHLAAFEPEAVAALHASAYRALCRLGPGARA
jgi:glycosyltransferase involved in cell wall biosynthesis